jgi:hypothetical protein
MRWAVADGDGRGVIAQPLARQVSRERQSSQRDQFVAGKSRPTP